MTTIMAWAAVDQRSVASLYIMSDSRITWAPSQRWDQGRKTFASVVSPHIFGYWGDVLFPSIALGTVVDLLSSGAIPPAMSDFDRFNEAIQQLWADYPEQLQQNFGIIIASRKSLGMNATFKLAVLTFEARTQTWAFKEIRMPLQSAHLHLDGSGKSGVRGAAARWEASQQGGTSRAVYSAFVEALIKGEDPRSGGAPQLVGLRRTGPGLRFGVVYQGHRYLAGARLLESVAAGEEVEWFNELFERVSGVDGKRLTEAQAHAPRKNAR